MRPFSEPLVDPKCRQSIVNSSQNRCWPFAKHVSFGVPFWSNFGTILDPSWAIGALWGTFFLDQFYDFFGARFWSQSGAKNGLVHRGAVALWRHGGGTVAARWRPWRVRLGRGNPFGVPLEGLRKQPDLARRSQSRTGAADLKALRAKPPPCFFLLYLLMFFFKFWCL